ncbi:lysine N(6)-hydroxylase/L-ornithine N(5)-oxygenase family protein [Arthrobacter castelli]|uniref:lysine N(6)-hydroxylase/L-ornithine N(5)-oxygenase family protein n=1 Tax=Arthrobacter castelli TaxID=271431 RepID=UPI0004023F0F|nr:lysine N(6)-hydroxylase/L-ornithine N(5)-oxygenase family protein [Arthrobacter castelli]
MDEPYDFIGIGLGPFNLGLAALTAPITCLNGLFLEQESHFDWHPGMMLDSSTLQVPFMADLVTMADPTSEFSFLNFLKSTGRIYPFYIRERFNPLRAEYNQYCQWVAGRLPMLRFGSTVDWIEYDDGAQAYSVRLATGERFQARRLVLGTGTRPAVPEVCGGLEGPALHSADYLHRREELLQRSSITVVGSGQSAAEIYFDLLQEMGGGDFELNWVTRSGRFFPLEYAKLTLEMTSPEYCAYFRSLPETTRDRLNADQQNLYKGIDESLINEIYDLLYQKSLHGPVNTNLLSNSDLQAAHWDGAAYSLEFLHREQDRSYGLRTEALVLATGYQSSEPDFLAGLEPWLNRDGRGRLAADGHYRVDAEAGHGAIYVQNAELNTHGFVAPDLGMGAYRNSCIIRNMLGWEYYPVESRIGFQQFGAPVPDREEPLPAVEGAPL